MFATFIIGVKCCPVVQLWLCTALPKQLHWVLSTLLKAGTLAWEEPNSSTRQEVSHIGHSAMDLKLIFEVPDIRCLSHRKQCSSWLTCLSGSVVCIHREVSESFVIVFGVSPNILPHSFFMRAHPPVEVYLVIDLPTPCAK